MLESSEPDSNVTVESNRHSAKHRVDRRSTAEGMQIDERDEQPSKAWSSILESSQPDSNVTVEREMQPAKHRAPSVVREEGRQIDASDEHALKADASMQQR
jgi:hypothetical protein